MIGFGLPYGCGQSADLPMDVAVEDDDGVKALTKPDNAEMLAPKELTGVYTSSADRKTLTIGSTSLAIGNTGCSGSISWNWIANVDEGRWMFGMDKPVELVWSRISGGIIEKNDDGSITTSLMGKMGSDCTTEKFTGNWTSGAKKKVRDAVPVAAAAGLGADPNAKFPEALQGVWTAAKTKSGKCSNARLIVTSQTILATGKGSRRESMEVPGEYYTVDCDQEFNLHSAKEDGPILKASMGKDGAPYGRNYTFTLMGDELIFVGDDRYDTTYTKKQ